MSHLVSDKLIRLDLGDGEWVDFKKRLSVGDYEYIGNNSGGDKPEARIVATLVVCLKAWCMKDEDGKEVELTPENIARLDSETATKILGVMGSKATSKKARTKTS